MPLTLSTQGTSECLFIQPTAPLGRARDLQRVGMSTVGDGRSAPSDGTPPQSSTSSEAAMGGEPNASQFTLDYESEGSIWKRTEKDQLANVMTTSALLAFSTVSSSGTNKLILIDHLKSSTQDGRAGAAQVPQSEIRVWSNRQQIQSRPISGNPSALVAFHVAASEGGGPALAVASESTVYIYVNLRAYAKFSVPDVPVSTGEQEVWSQMRETKGPIDMDQTLATLVRLHDEHVELSPQSHRLLLLETDEERTKFVEKYRNTAPRTVHAITALAALHQNATTEGSPQCVVIGTERGDVYVVTPGNYSVVHSFVVPAGVVQIGTQGSFQVEFRLLVMCRDGRIYRLKGGDPIPIGIELPSHAIGAVRVNKTQFVDPLHILLPSCAS